MTLGPVILFCPADRPERYEKAAAAADAVILDLEDAVAPADKSRARTHLAGATLDPSRTVVRINPAGTADHRLDLEAVAATPYRTIMLAKAESADQCDALYRAGHRIIALCETALGVENASEIARHPGVDALMWGAEDLIASLAGRSSRFTDGRYRDVARYARSRVLIAAGAAGKGAWDAVHLAITDTDGLRAEAEDAAASGFQATACIHPSQAAVIRTAYQPAAEDIEWARAMLDEAGRQPGVFRFRGRMVDEPVLRQARRIAQITDRQAMEM